MRALPIRKQTRFAPPSLHIFCTSSSEGIAEVSGKPPGIWSGVSVCWGRGLINHLLPSGGTFDIPELINGVLVLTIYISGVQRHSMVTLGALW